MRGRPAARRLGDALAGPPLLKSLGALTQIFSKEFREGAFADSMVTANAFVAVTGVIVFVLLAIRTRIEEAKLTERFGDRYRDYMRTTPRFFPRLTNR